MAYNAPALNAPWIRGLGLGVLATWAQVTILREAMSLAGGSEIALALGLTGWLLGVGAGALLGLLPPPRLGALLASGTLAGPLVASATLGLRLHRPLLGLAPGQELSLAGLAGLAIAGAGLAGFAAGFLFTLAARSARNGDRRPVTRLYLGEAVGALFAGAAHTFWLAGRAEPLALIVAGAAIFVAACGLPASTFRGRIATSGLIAALILPLVPWPGAPSLLGRLELATRDAAFRHLGAGGRLVAAAESPYGRLTLGERDGQFQLFADGRLDHAFPDPWDAPLPVHLALAAHPRPRKVLLLGGAVPDRLEAVLARNPARVVVTFLDAAALDLTSTHWPDATLTAARDPRVELVADDGRRFVERTDERFDVVIVSARPPHSAREMRFHTREFFAALHGILEPGGIVAVRAPGGATVLAPESARALAGARATLGQAFPHLLLVPGIETWILAGDRELPADPGVLAERYRDVAAPGFSPQRFTEALEPARLRALERRLEGVVGRVDTDRTPAGYLANLELWERHASRPGQTAEPTWIGGARERAWLWLAVPLLLWGAWQGPRLVRRRGGLGGGRAAVAVFAMGVTGAAGMTVTVVTLYAFQASAGTVYTTLGLLTGLFMAGLAAGAAAGGRWLASRPGVAGIVASGATLLFLLATGPAVAELLGHPWFIAAWAALGGAVTGAAFPALLAAASGGGDERAVAGAIESADHLGAAFGAFAVGVIWLPVHGLVATCLLMAALQACALIGLILPGRR